MRFDSASDRPKVGCAVSTMPVRAPLPPRLEGFEVGRRGSAFDELGKFLVGRCAVDEADALAQVARTLHAGAVHQAPGERL